VAVVLLRVGSLFLGVKSKDDDATVVDRPSGTFGLVDNVRDGGSGDGGGIATTGASLVRCRFVVKRNRRPIAEAVDILRCNDVAGLVIVDLKSIVAGIHSFIPIMLVLFPILFSLATLASSSSAHGNFGRGPDLGSHLKSCSSIIGEGVGLRARRCCFGCNVVVLVIVGKIVSDWDSVQVTIIYELSPVSISH
jgi:hypothetical protein